MSKDDITWLNALLFIFKKSILSKISFQKSFCIMKLSEDTKSSNELKES